MQKLFFVDIKNAQGEYEPLGIMTMRDACAYAWNMEEAVLNFIPLENAITESR